MIQEDKMLKLLKQIFLRKYAEDNTIKGARLTYLLRSDARKVGLKKPIGWIIGFYQGLLYDLYLDGLIPIYILDTKEPFPVDSLAYNHYMDGRLSARTV
jgi:hypothetical protein